MMWSILTSGPHIESLNENYRPKLDSAGIHVVHLPLAQGAMPFIHLDDLGTYARSILDNPSQSNGRDLEIATAHATGQKMAAALTARNRQACPLRRCRSVSLPSRVLEHAARWPGHQDRG